MAKSKKPAEIPYDHVDHPRHNNRLALFVVVMISLVGAVGLYSVYNDNQSTGAAMFWAGNPGSGAPLIQRDEFYCRSQADCAFNEVCTSKYYGGAYGKICAPSHECVRDMDCLNLGYNPTQMECVKNWCHVRADAP